jgi:hypothetical protein
MRLAVIAIALGLGVLPQVAHACSWVSEAAYRNAQRSDRAVQRDLVARIATEASVVVVAVARVVPGNENAAVFATERELKGRTLPEFEAHWDGVVRFGCVPSVEFRNVRIEYGMTYLLYLSGAEILRASPQDSQGSGITFEEELSLAIRALGALNNAMEQPRAGGL